MILEWKAGYLAVKLCSIILPLRAQVEQLVVPAVLGV